MSETRALNAALSGPVFHGAATRSALHASERHVERWAPEGAAAQRSGGLRSLGFADRIAMPWMTAAMQSRGARMMAQPTADRGTPEVSWLFPRPWFQDELDWMAAARQGAEQAPQFLTTRGTYASSRTSMADVAMPMLTPSQVAPSMASHAASRPTMGVDTSSSGTSSAGLAAAMPAGFTQMQQSLRTYSPVVPFAAASAAEVVAGTIGMAAQSGLASAASDLSGRSPILSGLTVVAPSSLMDSAAAPSSRFAPSPAAPVERAMPTTTRALFEAAKAQVARVEDVRHQPAETRASAEAAAAASPAPEAPTASETTYTSASTSDHSLAQASSASSEVARALRTVDLLFQAAAPAPAVAGEAPRASGFEPSAGPRVAMPSGLGGLMTAIDAQRATTTPLARMTASPMAAGPMMAAAAVTPFVPALARAAVGSSFDPIAAGESPAALRSLAAPGAETRLAPAFAPVWAAPSTALGSIASERARAVDHVAWSDRWLARFVGASPVALAALDATRESPSPDMRGRTVAGPEQIYLQPPMPAAALSAAIRGSVMQPLAAPGPAQAASTPAGRPGSIAAQPGRLRVDDNEPVSDDIFAAIAAASVPRAPTPAAIAAAAARAPEQPLADRLAEARPLTPADVVRGGARPNLADLVAISPPPAPDAGLSPGLASSPLAPAMAGVLPMAAAPTFDPRSLFPEAVSQAYLGGFLARSAAPIGVVSSAPTMRALVSAASFGSSSALASLALGAPDDAGEAGTSPAAAPWMTAARAWSSRDLMVSPPSLRLAEAAPARVTLSADVESVRRGFAPSAAFAAQMATSSGAPDARGVVQRAAASPVAAPITSDLASPAGVEAAPFAGTSEAAAASSEARIAASETAEPAGPVAPPAWPPAIEAELLTLRAALLAAPGPTSTPLAFADHLPLLSAATRAPSAAISAPAFADETGAAPDLDLTLPVHAMAAPAGARGLALPAVGAAALAAGGMPAGTLGAGDRGFTPVAGAFEGAATPTAIDNLYAMQAPNAFTSTGRPGSLAEMILSWSVAEERSAANLAFDFVAPEMVLAAKVYGLSPAAAAQASRLAIAGPGAIASLATSVDMTFLRGFQQVHAQDAMRAAAAPGGGGLPAARAAARSAAGEVAAPPDGVGYASDAPGQTSSPEAVAAAAMSPAAAAASSSYASPSYATGLPGAAPSFGPDAGQPAAAFGATPSLASEILSGARLPRGAFLWPEATVAALGMRALSPDGVAGMPVVALELLAAAAVADLGTWITAFPSADRERITAAMGGGRGRASMPFTAGATGTFDAGVTAGAAGIPAGIDDAPLAAGPGYAAAAYAAAGSPVSPTAAATAAAEAGEAGFAAADVLAPELATAPRDVRAQFQAIYIALASTGEGQMLSPSARAARAMSMLARTESGAALSPRERALTAWSAMPQVYQGSLDVVAPSAGASDDGAPVESRTGLAALAARAGESLGSFVSPSMAEMSGSSWGGESYGRGASGPAGRAEMPVYVQTAAASSAAVTSTPLPALARPGRAFAQSGGGEPEIPSWFEAAARAALEQRSPGSSMSMAELVLVNAAASSGSRAIAAATRGASSAAPAQVAGAGAQGNQEGEKPDVDKIAHEVYLEVLKLIEIARMRSGDPFQ